MPRTVDININGVPPFRLAADNVSDHVVYPYMARHGLWEPLQTELITRLVRPHQTVVDVGAHVGYHTILLSKLVGAEGVVYAFEPAPDNHDLLIGNVQLNNAHNVRTYRLALVDRSGEETLYLSTENSGDHRLYPEPGDAQSRVVTDTLDRRLPTRDGRVDFVKLDVQGAEPRTLAGMKHTVAVNRLRLACLIEFDPVRLKRAAGSLQVFLDQLSRLDARVDYVDFHRAAVRITRLSDVRALKSVARQLNLKGQDGLLLACFSDTARASALERIRCDKVEFHRTQ